MAHDGPLLFLLLLFDSVQVSPIMRLPCCCLFQAAVNVHVDAANMNTLLPGPPATNSGKTVCTPWQERFGRNGCKEIRPTRFNIHVNLTDLRAAVCKPENRCTDSETRCKPLLCAQMGRAPALLFTFLINRMYTCHSSTFLQVMRERLNMSLTAAALLTAISASA